MKSMTGFGRAEVDAPFGKLVGEVQAVNRKFLEVNVSLPKEFSSFENEVRKQVGEVVGRGSIIARFYVIPNGKGGLLPDAKILKAMKKSWVGLAKEVGLSVDSIDLPFLLGYLAETPRIVSNEEYVPFKKCLGEALKALEKMRELEGKALAKDIALRLESMKKAVREIEKLSGKASEKMRERLKERLEEVLAPGAALDDRLLREVALFAERVDVSEEITRFRSHVEQFTGAGRKMDFLVQEMGREINTIGSKSMDAKISQLVVEVKAELEKVREQVQNIE